VSLEGLFRVDAIPSSYRRSGLFLSRSETASLDNGAIREAMGYGCIPVSTSEALRQLISGQKLTCLVPELRLERLPDRVTRVLDRVRDNHATGAGALRHIVEQDHSLRSLMNRLMDRLTELTDVKRARRASPPTGAPRR
jgi:hypothetical protein